jgi:hypothetical protein
VEQESLWSAGGYVWKQGGGSNVHLSALGQLKTQVVRSSLWRGATYTAVAVHGGEECCAFVTGGMHAYPLGAGCSVLRTVTGMHGLWHDPYRASQGVSLYLG